MISKICKRCGEEFIPKSSRQEYCKKEIELVCPVCGDTYIGCCQPNNPTTCSKSECKKQAAVIGAKNKTKICRVCGKPFTPNSTRQLDCNRPITRTCVICGKEFTAKCSLNDKTKTCSKECLVEYTHQQQVAGYANETRICELCGKPFTPTNNTQRICNADHFMKCVICGKEFKIDTSKNKEDWPKTCSKECANKLRFQNGNPFQSEESRAKARQHYFEKTGYAHPMQNPEVIQKLKITMKERYGDTPYQRSEEYRNKTIKTNLAKYGTEWALQSEIVKDKVKQTVMSHYGVDNVFKSPEVRETYKQNYLRNTGYEHPAQNPEVQKKAQSTNLARYGVKYAIVSKETRDKTRQTIRKKYGVDNAMKNSSVVDKVKATNLARYGSTSFIGSKLGRQALVNYHRSRYNVDYNSQTRNWKSTRIKDPSKVDNWVKFISNPDSVLCEFDHKPSMNELQDYTGATVTSISAWVKRLHLEDRIKYTLSTMEDDVCKFLDSLGVSFNRHRRDIIKPYELDIYLPDFRVAIECNPTATHNSSIPFYDCDSPISPSYHKMKTDLCIQEGIQLFHLFGYEWEYKKDIMKSMLSNILGKSSDKIYARNTKVVELDPVICYSFLDKNHRQGRAYSAVKLGLIHEDEIVAVMTFGKPRRTIGDGRYDWELVRFCNKLNTNVVGGASKLFQYFIKRYRNTNSIVSFSDRAHTTGNLYRKLGFSEIRSSDPGYVWVDTRTDVAYNRINAQKQNLKQFLHDETIDLSKTEKQIMEEHEFVQVFDSGTTTWEYHKQHTGFDNAD